MCTFPSFSQTYLKNFYLGCKTDNLNIYTIYIYLLQRVKDFEQKHKNLIRICF